MKKAVIMIFCLAFLLSMVNSGDFKYVGVKKCKMCHKGERKGNVYEKWMEKAHAKAFETLKKEGQEKNPKCLECHTTAFNQGGYKLDDPKASNFEGVQCESCHGPGSVFKKTSIMKNREMALKNGLIDINEKTCTVCHDGTKCEHAKGFDYQKGLKTIDHTYTKK